MKSRKLNDGLFPCLVPRCLRIYVYLTTRVCKNIALGAGKDSIAEVIEILF